MKNLSVGLLSHLAQATTQLATGVKVVRTDGQTFAWTTLDAGVTIDSIYYRPALGLTPSTARTSDDFSVSTLDITAFLDVTTEDELAAGIWDNAEVTVFDFRFDTLPTVLDDTVLITRFGNLGEIKREEGKFTAEIRGLAQRLSRRIGRAYSPTCPWRHARWNGSTYVSSTECGLDLTGGSPAYIRTGAMTADGSDRMTCPDNLQSAAMGFFDEGLITFTSGDNAGITREVRRWENQQFALYRPYPYDILTGDTYTAVKGDNKTFAACQGFSNYKNFGGFPSLPGIAQVYANPTGL